MDLFLTLSAKHHYSVKFAKDGVHALSSVIAFYHERVPMYVYSNLMHSNPSLSQGLHRAKIMHNRAVSLQSLSPDGMQHSEQTHTALNILQGGHSF